MSDSSNAFETYKKEIEGSRKEIIKLTKEVNGWKKRYEKVNAALVVSKQSEALVEDLKRKNAALEKLCRALRVSNASPASSQDGGGAACDPGDGAAAARSTESENTEPQV